MGSSLDTIKKLNPIKQLNDIGSYANPARILSSGLTHLSSIEFARKYLWRVRFWPMLSHIVPPDFINGLPLVDFDLEDANIDSFSREYFMSTYKVPLKSKERTLKLTFYDNANNELFHWIRDWINIDILNNGNFISCINDGHKRAGSWSNGLPVFGSVEPTRKIIVERLAPDLSVAYLQTLTIFPEGELVYNGTSESNVHIYTMNFVIIDDGEKTIDDKGGGFGFNLFGAAGSNVLDGVLGLSSSNLDIGKFF